MQNHLPNIAFTSKVHLQPLAILDRRVTKHKSRDITKVLVQWFDLLAKEATWETYHFLKERFLEFIAA